MERAERAEVIGITGKKEEKGNIITAMLLT